MLDNVARLKAVMAKLPDGDQSFARSLINQAGRRGLSTKQLACVDRLLERIRTQTFHVIYAIRAEGPEAQTFRCEADDAAHAKEQCLDAYPKAKIIRIEEVAKPVTVAAIDSAPIIALFDRARGTLAAEGPGRCGQHDVAPERGRAAIPMAWLGRGDDERPRLR